MGSRMLWTKVLILVLSLMFLGSLAETTWAVKRRPAQAKPGPAEEDDEEVDWGFGEPEPEVKTAPTKHGFEAETHDPKKPREFSDAWIKLATHKLATIRTQCAKKKKKCKNAKLFKDYEDVLKSFGETKTQAAVLSEENRTLTHQLRISHQTNMLASRLSCDKKMLRRELLLDEGISENGSIVFKKSVVSATGAVCWSNSRKKKEASITVCEWPLAINIFTKAEIDRMPVIRTREYLFDPNECLQAVRVVDESISNKKVTELNYKECEKEWNNKSFTDLDPGQQVRKIDIVGACFRYYLLPPRDSKAGRTNPDTSTPQKAK